MIHHDINRDTFTKFKYGNIHYELKEKILNNMDKIPYNSLIEELENFLESTEIKENNFNGINSYSDSDNDDTYFTDLDKCLALTVEYNDNYTIKDLQKIAEYYEISMRKLCKSELAEKIITFEDNSDNKDRVTQRKKMWFYMKEIKHDKHLKQFLIFDSPILSK